MRIKIARKLVYFITLLLIAGCNAKAPDKEERKKPFDPVLPKHTKDIVIEEASRGEVFLDESRNVGGNDGGLQEIR